MNLQMRWRLQTIHIEVSIKVIPISISKDA